jgi:hypothetical protein
MANASLDGDHMPWAELHRVAVKINVEATFQREKTLIGVGMTVPMICLSHSTYANFMIVDFGNSVVVVIR